MPFFSTVYIIHYKDISQNMHVDVVLSEFIHPCSKSGGELNLVFAQSWCGCLCACDSVVCACVCFRFPCTQPRASYMLNFAFGQVLMSSSDTWDWTRMHALVVMHRRPLYEKCGQCQNKGAFLCYRYRYCTRGIDASYRHTLYRYIDESLSPSKFHTHNFLTVVLWSLCPLKKKYFHLMNRYVVKGIVYPKI